MTRKNPTTLYQPNSFHPVNTQSSVIIQARTSSERFPGKVLYPLKNNIPIIEYVYNRCKNSSFQNVLVATSIDKADDELFFYCRNNNIPVFRGNLLNVLERFIKAASSINSRYILRVCADSPFVDIFLMELLLNTLIEEKLDYTSLNKRTCAAGFISEAITLSALRKISSITNSKDYLEHVTKYIIENQREFKVKFINVNLKPEFIKQVSLTIDYPRDIELANEIISELGNRFNFTSEEILTIVNNKIKVKNYE